MASLYELKEHLAMLGAQISEDATWIAEKAAKPETPMEDIDKRTAHRDDLQKRFDLLKAEHDKIEDEQRARVKAKAELMSDDEGDRKTAKAKLRGEFYRAVLDPESGDARKAYQMLGGIPALDADLGYGSKLLPSTMTNELITEPLVENPMRAIVRVSNITGLEEPKLLFDMDGVFDSITDKETAREVEMEGDLVVYGRNKVKVRARVSDTIVHGSALNISGEIDNALRSGLAANEMARMFAATPATDYAHMSFYSTVNAVKAVTAATKQEAIGKALADLNIAYRRNARIVMNATDWFDMWGQNLNQSGMFFENRPLTLFGKPVVLVDDAIDPVVGDFGYARINYDINATYDADKDVDGGIYKFVLTAWYDIKLRMKAAFRIAKSTANP